MAHNDDWLIIHWTLSIFMGLCGELGLVLEKDMVKSQASFHTTADRISFLHHRAIPKGTRRLDRTEPLVLALHFACCMGQDRPYGSQVHNHSYEVVDQAIIEAQFTDRASFPDVIGVIDCTHCQKRTTRG